MPEVASRVVADLGASDQALDAFSSGTSAHLRVCEKYCSAQDSVWKKHWGPHQGWMWIHCPRWDIPRAVAKIRKDRSKAVLVVPVGCTEEESTRDWVVSLTNMTLNKVVLPAGESVHQDAKGQLMPPQRWPTEFHYVDRGLEQADETDFVCVNRIIAEPWRQCSAVSPVDIGESEDLLTEEELDLVQGYMDQPFHDWGSQHEGKGQDKAWWEVDPIVSGSYDGNTFVRRVLDHMSSQDEPIGGNPPTYGDLFRGKTRDGPLGHLGTPPGDTRPRPTMIRGAGPDHPWDAATGEWLQAALGPQRGWNGDVSSLVRTPVSPRIVLHAANVLRATEIRMWGHAAATVWWHPPEDGAAQLAVAHFKAGGPVYDDAVSRPGDTQEPLLLVLRTGIAAALRQELDGCEGLQVGWEAVADGTLLALLHRDTANGCRWDALTPHLTGRHVYMASPPQGHPRPA